jgi:hypothetical protein
MSRLADKEPAYIEDGQCFYPPFYAASFTRELAEGLAPFSVECEWADFMDFSDKKRLPMPNWVAELHFYGYEAEDIYISDEKWGYCNVKTGEIEHAPQWESCSDFCKAGYAVVKGNRQYGVIAAGNDEWLFPRFDEIQIAHPDYTIAFARYGEKWGAIDMERDDPHCDAPEVDTNWDGIWWDGFGGYTVMQKCADGSVAYSIINHGGRKIVISGLSEKPVRYDPPSGRMRKNTYRDGARECPSFRIIQRDGQYGLVMDYPGDTDSSTLELPPCNCYEDVIEAAEREDIEAEIGYYAYLISRTPKCFTRVAGQGYGWEAVPDDIRDAVNIYMVGHGWEQPETPDDV